jgi:hypothetical protein
MLTAVKDLLTVVFAQKEARGDVGPYRFEMGEMNVILRMGTCFYLTTVIRGEESKAASKKSEAVMQAVQERYGHILSDWLGGMNEVEGVQEIITQLLSIENLSEKERERIRDRGFFKKVLELWSLLNEE